MRIPAGKSMDEFHVSFLAPEDLWARNSLESLQVAAELAIPHDE
jgi:hypothetical protein